MANLLNREIIVFKLKLNIVGLLFLVLGRQYGQTIYEKMSTIRNEMDATTCSMAGMAETLLSLFSIVSHEYYYCMR